MPVRNCLIQSPRLQIHLVLRLFSLMAERLVGELEELEEKHRHFSMKDCYQKMPEAEIFEETLAQIR
uniref:Uncharacterized protein n=1 Tax=Rhizophora mucronata TaxID=61149 RepID=A0A2P2PJ10_RHIMU